MKNLNKFILLATVTLCTKQLSAQTLKTGDITMHISAQSFVGKKHAIDIYKTHSSIKIVYATEDSVKLSELRKNADYTRLSNNYMEQMKAINISPNTNDSLRILRESYTVYDRDSITFNPIADTAYNNLLIRVAKSTKEELLEPEKNKNIVLLDGVHVQYEIIDESTNKILGANTPREKRYPLLYKLLKSTLDIGRKQKLKVLLTKGFLGY